MFIYVSSFYYLLIFTNIVVLHDLVGNSSFPTYSSPYNGTTNLNVDNHPHYNDTLTLKRDYRLRKTMKQDDATPDEVKAEDRNSKSKGLEDEYVSKSQRFVERNKEAIDSGAMFQMQPIPKSKIRFTDITIYMYFVKSWNLFILYFCFITTSSSIFILLI